MRPWLVLIAVAAGNLSADSLWYTLGYAGKLEWALRFGRKLGLRPDILERLKQGMREHAARILFMAKLTVSFMIPALITAGLMKVPLRRWFPALFAAEMIWTGSLVLIGYYATEALKRVEQGVEYLILVLSLASIYSPYPVRPNCSVFPPCKPWDAHARYWRQMPSLCRNWYQMA